MVPVFDTPVPPVVWLPPDVSSWLRIDHPDVLAKYDTILHVEGADSSNNVTKLQCREYTMQIAHILRKKFAIGVRDAGVDTVACISTGQSFSPRFSTASLPRAECTVRLARASRPEGWPDK
ncbi:hypothetical protein N7471_009310 [Penicillium samsonianum]|uniref:uncharacterized protein n=1 Tax=Penicillium samsonianum TaxID=1882272 RepID=UPI0025466DE3|nr:uncharacterized protein N7471_009310 [Penicillium samsonianum]KAJ6128093.1 hypothetical protein N7471_009310 [Penicillium samsonianum]